MDPNLTEPRLQDQLQRRLNDASASASASASAARAARSAPGQNSLLCYQFVPYSAMSEQERRKFLPANSQNSRKSKSSRSSKKAEDADSGSFWPSGAREKPLKAYQYHLAELSLHYRCQPEQLLAKRGRRLQSQQQQQQQQHEVDQTLFYRLHSRRSAPPAAAPTSLKVDCPTQTRGDSDYSRGCTPFIDSGLSDYPAEPLDLVHASQSNRLLNVVSVDECHVRHRRRRRRIRRKMEGEEREGENEEEMEEYENEDEYEEEYEEEEEEEYKNEYEVSTEAAATPLNELIEQTVQSVASSPPPEFCLSRATSRRTRDKKRTEQEMRVIAANRFARRNQLLREKMGIYMDWKLHEQRLHRSDGAKLASIRKGGAADRFDRFLCELAMHESAVASSYRGSSGFKRPLQSRGVADDGIATGDLISSDVIAASDVTADRMQSSGGDSQAEKLQNLSLTEMFEALNA